MIRILATLCSLSTGQCHDQLVTTSDFAGVSLQSCLMGAPQLADYMRSFPQYRLAGWKCQVGQRGEHA